MGATKDSFTLIAKTNAGLETILAQEIRQIGATDIEILNRAVRFSADLELMYKANYLLRTALRILKPIHHFRAKTEDQLYKGVQDFDWSLVMQTDQSFAIDEVVTSPHFTHSHYIALKTKDAIVDQFRDREGKRPSVDINFPDVRLNLHISNDQCSLLLDSSGTSLHKRGYRSYADKAPINEVLAAGLIQLSGWQADSHFLDGMCGSGTIPIEAAMFAMRIPAGYYRKEFGFMKWADFDRQCWQQVVDEANEQISEFDHQIIGSDRSRKALEIARRNIRQAHLHKDITLLRKPIEEFTPPEGKGVVIINPPYGERLEEEDVYALYKSIGDTFKTNFKGYQAWVISSELQALKRLGLKPSKKFTVYNGALECRFACFDIFAGSLKERKREAHAKE